MTRKRKSGKRKKPQRGLKDSGMDAAADNASISSDNSKEISRNFSDTERDEMADYTSMSSDRSKEISPNFTERSLNGPNNAKHLTEVSELTVMLLGKTKSGKSALGNVILGEDHAPFKCEQSPFPVTKRCEVQSKVVKGRNTTVIDTPAITSGKNTWVSEVEEKLPCHVFLLVIQLGRFSEEDSNEIEFIESNFGEEALKYTTVVFRGEQLNQKTAEEFISESVKLQTLKDRVEKRCCVLESLNPDPTQVEEIFKMIDRSLRKHAGYGHLKHVKKEKAERKEENMSSGASMLIALLFLALFGLAALLHSGVNFYQYLCPEAPLKMPELRVMLLGKTGSGKSASGNTILDRLAFKSEASARPVTKYCEKLNRMVEGRNITVIDTPGIQDRWLSNEEVGMAKTCLHSTDHDPHVFLLVLPMTRFTENDRHAPLWIQENFGQEALKFTMVLFTGGDQLKGKPVEMLLQENAHLKNLVCSVGGGYHVFNNDQSTDRSQVKSLIEKIETLLLARLGYSYTHGIHENVEKSVRGEEEQIRKEIEKEIREEEARRREEAQKHCEIQQREELKEKDKPCREKENLIRAEEERKLNFAVADVAEWKVKVQNMEDQKWETEKEKWFHRGGLFIAFILCVLVLFLKIKRNTC